MIPKSGYRFSDKDHAQLRTQKRDDDLHRGHRALRPGNSIHSRCESIKARAE
jgi:hypothetical protein